MELPGCPERRRLEARACSIRRAVGRARTSFVKTASIWAMTGQALSLIRQGKDWDGDAYLERGPSSEELPPSQHAKLFDMAVHHLLHGLAALGIDPIKIPSQRAAAELWICQHRGSLRHLYLKGCQCTKIYIPQIHRL